VHRGAGIRKVGNQHTAGQDKLAMVCGLPIVPASGRVLPDAIAHGRAVEGGVLLRRYGCGRLRRRAPQVHHYHLRQASLIVVRCQLPELVQRMVPGFGGVDHHHLIPIIPRPQRREVGM
jgi:hypothetical protein